MFSVAVGTGGGAALAVSGAMYAANLMKNEKVQNFMSRIESKVSDTLVRFGFKEENVEERKTTLGERMKSITSNKWFKIGTAAAAVGMLGVGVGALLHNGGLDAIKSGYDAVANADYEMLKGDAYLFAQNTVAGAYDGVVDGAEYASEAVSGFYEAITDDSFSIMETLGNSAEEATLAAQSTAESVMEEASNLFNSDSVTPVENPTPVDPSVEDSVTRATGPAIDDLVPEGTDSAAPSADGSETSSDLTNADLQQAHVEYEVKDGDNAWNIVEDYLTTAGSQPPTDAQILAVVEDLGLENPDLIYPGDTINLPADVQQYGVVPGSEASFNADPFVAEEPPEFAADIPQIPSEVDISRYVDFEEILKVHGLYESITLSELQSMNPDLDFANLSPQDTMTLHPDLDITYTVPSVDQMVIETSFPNGVPEHLDTDQYVKDVLSINENHNLNEGWFGMQALNGNPLLGQEILSNGPLKTPDVDLGSLVPSEQGQANIAGRNIGGDLDKAIIDSAFPEGAPKYLDEQAFVSSVKDANPGLSVVMEGDYYSENFVLPGTEAAANSNQIVQDFDKENAISNFRDRFAGLGKSGLEPS
jgi:nucleoid-associated protein YgaU